MARWESRGLGTPAETTDMFDFNLKWFNIKYPEKK
jgi:hypothetical protein